MSSFLTVHQHILGYFVPSDGVPKMSPCFSEMETHFGEDIHRRRLRPTGIPGNSYALNLRRDSRKFLQHCMQGRRGLSDENSVRLSVRQTNVWIVTKRKKDLSRFLYHTKERPFLPKILGQPAPIGAKSPIFNQ